MNDLKINKARESAEIEANKFQEIMTAIGKDTWINITLVK